MAGSKKTTWSATTNGFPLDSPCSPRDEDMVEPVAIVGLSLEFPQSATSMDAFWDLLMNKRNTATEFPEERLSISNLYHPDQDRKGQISVRRGHFLHEDIATFDAPFFSITSSDAALMDPQQRRLLEHTFKALENAGIPLNQSTGSKTSVYIGAFTNDWQHLSFKDSEECGTTTALGVQPCVNANRISWFFDFKGNSANIDTACSSSLVALDLGCKDLRNRETNMSIVGGSSLTFSPDYLHSLSNMNMLSPDGQCYSFDRRGTGYGRGEGFGILVLKRVSDALRDGDTIRAVIRNSSCNQDGNTPGITQPNSKSQEALIRETYLNAGLSMFPARFFEAHGTGTAIGDPTEANALGAAFSKTRTVQDPLVVGAVKSNIGHLEGCSGIASVIKTILVLETGIIPPNTNFEQLNPKIDTEYLKIKFPLEPLVWPCQGLRRASVNSFGYAGTNAHAILDDALHYLEQHDLAGHHSTTRHPHLSEDPQASDSTSIPPVVQSELALLPQLPKVLVFSAQDESGMERQISAYRSYFTQLMVPRDHFNSYIDNLVYTLDHKRTALAWRSFAVIESFNDLTTLDRIISPARLHTPKATLGFVFTGQGAQWPGMGRELSIFPAFQRSLQKSELDLSDIGCPWLLQKELGKEGEHSSIHCPDYSQPICTAVQIALIDLLNDFGIEPVAVIGHSSGEIAAAYAFGAISAKSALKLAYFRGLVSASLVASKQGGMLSVGLSPTDVQPYIDEASSRFRFCDLTTACINSHKNVTVSGSVDQIEALKVLLDERKIFARKLQTGVAYHSPHMRPIADKYRSLIQGIEKGERASRCNIMISSVTAERITAAELQDPEYWVTNLVSPVKFSEAINHFIGAKAQIIRKKLDLSHRHKLNLNMLVEVGPHSALQGPIRYQLTRTHVSHNIAYTSVLRRHSSALKTILGTVGEIKCFGYPVDLVKICVPRKKSPNDLMVLPDLPSYQFDHSKSYWFESRINNRFRTQRQGKLDLLGKPVSDWNPLESKWRHHLRVAEMPWMEDHVINGATIYPGAGMLVMAIEAAHQMADQARKILGFELKDVYFREPLSITRDPAGLETQFSLRLSPETSETVSDWSEFRLCAYEQTRWHESCRGFVRVQYETEHGEVDQGREASEELRFHQEIHAQMDNDCQEPINTDVFYKNLPKIGFDIGPAFQRIFDAAYGMQKQAKGNVRVFEWPQSQYPQAHIIHPTTLDAILQMSVLVLTEGGRKTVQTMIPNSVKYLRVNRNGLSYPRASTIKGYVWMRAQDNRGTEFDHAVMDEDGSCLLAEVQGMRLTIVAGSAASDADVDREGPSCYHVQYKPDLDFPGAINKLIHNKEAKHCVEDFLDTLSHKHPGLNVLEVGDGDAVRTIAEPFDAISMLNAGLLSYHYAGSSQSDLDNVQKCLAHHPRATFGLLDNIDDIEESSSRDKTYDVLVVPNSYCQHDQLQSSLRHVLEVLKIDGWLVTYSPRKQDVSNTDTITTWRKDLNGAAPWNPNSDWTLNTLDTSESLTVLRKSRVQINREQIWKSKSIVLIIDPTSVSQRRVAQEISVHFSIQGRGGCIETWSLDKASNMQNKTENIFIILLELDQPIIYNMSQELYTVLRRFLTTSQDILWLGRSESPQPRKPEFAAIDGLARVLRNERDDIRFTTVFFQSKEGLLTDRQLRLLSQVLEKNHLEPQPTEIQNEPEYLEIDGELHIPRLVRREELSQDLHTRSQPQVSSVKAIRNAPPLKLHIGSPGLLDTLQFVDDKDYLEPLGASEIEVRTEAIGVNFKDCLVALAQSPGSSLGLECAGTVTRVGPEAGFVPGERVVMAAEGAFRTFARGTSSAACKIPEGIDSVEAAAIPAQFLTAYAVICHMAKLCSGESILIHAAAGGTGQACVQIAHSLGATVLATVGSLDKKKILMEEYGIPEIHIFDSRRLSFAKGVKRVTKGRGADMIINSLAGEAMIASWECIAPCGRFVDIGKKDVVANSKLPMSMFAKGAAFMAFDYATWQEEHPREVKNDLAMLMNMFATKQLHVQRPLHVYGIEDFQEVFRSLANGRSAGKFVLRVTDKAQVPTTLQNTASFDLDPKATYVVAGGLGGLGRSTARWMSTRGARYLILLSRSGAISEVAKAFVTELRSENVRVEAPACDITNTEVVQRVLGNLLGEMPPVKGCVHATMVARDVLFQDMTFDDWQTGVASKTIGVWNLHNSLPKGMSFFILLSSASGLVGLRGQANYNAGNTYEDAFARYRVAVHGERTVSLDLGAMVDDGILAETPEALQRVLTYGVLHPLSRSRFYGILDYYCDPRLPDLQVDESQIVIGVGTRSGQSGGLDGFNLSRHPLFRNLVYESSSSSEGTVEADDDDSKFRSLFSRSTSLLEAANLVIEAVVRKLTKTIPTLPASVDDVDTNRPIQSWGVDSLLAVELRNWIKKEMRAEVAVFETQGASTFATLGRTVVEKSTLEHTNWSL